ncbi:hypothetical protein PO124_04800 [Bacillus licheniformis]|nr:hypothetical protein [Bacillus licheniformis]
MAVVFQEFGRYELSLRHNIAIGRTEALGDEENFAPPLGPPSWNRLSKSCLKGWKQ